MPPKVWAKIAVPLPHFQLRYGSRSIPLHWTVNPHYPHQTFAMITLLTSLFLYSNNANAEEVEPLPGAQLAFAGTMTNIAAPILTLSSAPVSTMIGFDPILVTAFAPPVGVAMAHYGNKKMLSNMGNGVDDNAYQWGQKFSKASLYSGLTGVGILGLGIGLSVNSTSENYSGLAFALLGGGFLSASGFLLLPATISYEIQRQRTNRTYRTSQTVFIEDQTEDSHFSISFVPKKNGFSLVGTF